jgi:hypothetical protein
MKEQDEVRIDRWRADRSAVRARRLRRSLFVSLLLAVVMLFAPVASPAEVAVGVSVTFGPPAIPVYAQPPWPGPGFIWAPGYWAWDPDIGYYWVPGVWVVAPFVGALWTPGYWAWNDAVFIWHEGYWGPVVGFYGGINYGFGYTGFGYAGGYWRGGTFYYNRAVNNIKVTNITNVYSKSVSNVRPGGVSFNGGPGGTTARPTSKQPAAARQQRSSLTGAQRQQMRAARADPKQRATVNRGRPAVAATTKPGELRGHGVISASRAGAPYREPPDHKTASGERVRTPKTGTEMHARATAPEKHIAHPRKKTERRVNESRRTSLRPAATKRSPRKEKIIAEKKESRRRVASAARIHPRPTEPQHIAHATPRTGPERRFNEPNRMPQRPTIAKPLPQKGKTRGERKEQG